MANDRSKAGTEGNLAWKKMGTRKITATDQSEAGIEEDRVLTKIT